jgi:opacity protein-like surface antigen
MPHDAIFTGEIRHGALTATPSFPAWGWGQTNRQRDEIMIMTKVLPLAAALTMLSATAFANDWSGLYLGAEAGAQFSNTQFSLPGDEDDVLLQSHNNKTSFIGGGIIGYNWVDGTTLFGIEADMTNGDKARVTACNVEDGCFTSEHDSFTTFNNVKTNWSGRLRARLGMTDGDMLYYAAAGYSRADTRLSLVGLCYDETDPTVPTIYNFGRSKNLSGFNLAIGAERALGEHFFVRVEYLYEDFGETTYKGAAPEWNDRRISIDHNDIRVAAAYKF